MSSRLDPDQTQRYVRPDLGPNCLQRLSAAVSSRQRVNSIPACDLICPLLITLANSSGPDQA